MTRAAVGRGVVAASVLALAVFLWGGYAAGWSWTGLSGDVALWDWLEALALPVTVGLLPVLLLHRDRLRGRPRIILVAASAVFVALVLAGYLVPWEWTGFTGNTLWDWLQLALLPIILATVTFWPAAEHLRPAHWAAFVTAGTVFLVIVLAGYLVPWSWTGFSDNKAWDWLKLLALPVLLPTVVLPALKGYLNGSPQEPAGEPSTPQ
jgi:hypothetical protein